jgi:GcrA cell cycle regulator
LVWAAGQIKGVQVEPKKVNKTPEVKKVTKEVKKEIVVNEILSGASNAINSLTPKSCRWPIGDPTSPKFHFYAKDKYLEKPYCEEHSKIAYIKSNHSR